jgi:hypothetical protein
MLGFFYAFDCRLLPGKTVAGPQNHLRNANPVIPGEGKPDAQSLQVKAIAL